MVWRKLSLIKSGKIEMTEGASFEIPYLKEARYITIHNIKKYEHMALVVIVKFYLQFSTSLKDKYQVLKIKIKNIHIRHSQNTESADKNEISRLLKMIAGYKNKIKEIKHKIKEEEKDL
jgi:hypothetical protein